MEVRGDIDSFEDSQCSIGFAVCFEHISHFFLLYLEFSVAVLLLMYKVFEEVFEFRSKHKGSAAISDDLHYFV